MTSLPSHEECHFDSKGNAVWALLLEAEQEALTKPTSDQHKHNTPLIAIRVLGFLLKDLWDNAKRWNLGDTAYIRLVEEVNCACKGEKKVSFSDLVHLGVRYRNRISRGFSPSLEPAHTLSIDEDSSPEFILLHERIIQSMKTKDGPTTQYDIKLQALLRDGFKWVCDFDAWLQLRGLDEAPQGPQGQTQVTYFFPEDSRDGSKKVQESPTSLSALLTIFGLEHQVDSLYGGTVNSLDNVITLEAAMHRFFDTFCLWLEPVEGQEHAYDVCGPAAHPTCNYGTGPLPSRIVFKVDPSAEAKAAEHNVTLNLPDPLLIAVRAICARVADMSGTTELLDQIVSNIEDRVDGTDFANDSDMAALLATCLTKI